MQSSEIEKRRLTLDDLAHIDEDTGIEYWYARDLQKLLGYVEWRKFEDAIHRARVSLESTKTPDEDHFVEAAKMVKLGSGAERQIKDYKLTRYACYLIAQNGDPRKEENNVPYFVSITKKGFAYFADDESPQPPSKLAEKIASVIGSFTGSFTRELNGL